MTTIYQIETKNHTVQKYQLIRHCFSKFQISIDKVKKYLQVFVFVEMGKL